MKKILMTFMLIISTLSFTAPRKGHRHQKRNHIIVIQTGYRHPRLHHFRRAKRRARMRRLRHNHYYHNNYYGRPIFR